MKLLERIETVPTGNQHAVLTKFDVSRPQQTVTDEYTMRLKVYISFHCLESDFSDARENALRMLMGVVYEDFTNFACKMRSALYANDYREAVKLLNDFEHDLLR